MINAKKITDAELRNNNVKAVAGSRLKGTVQENKHVFDKLTELIAERFNDVLDTLSTDGGSNIGIMVDGKYITIQDFANRPVYTKAEIEQIVADSTNDLVKDVIIDLSDGVFRFTKKDGTIYQVDTAIEKLPITLEFIIENDETYLKLNNQDGTSTKTLVKSLISHYEFDSGGDISYTITPIGKRKRVEGSLRAAVVKPEHLHANTLAKLDEYIVLCAAERTGAQTAAAQASAQAAAALSSAGTAEIHEANCEAIKNAADVKVRELIAQGIVDMSTVANEKVEQAALERKAAERAANIAKEECTKMQNAVERIVERIMAEVI